MTSLIWTGGLAVVLACMWLTRPLWRRSLGSAVQRKQVNIASYRTRLADIDQDLAEGAIDEAVAQQLRDEAATRLLGDVEGEPEADTVTESASPQRRLWLPLVLTVLVAATAGVGYYISDSRHVVRMIATSQQNPAAAQAMLMQEQLAELESELKSNPQDADGWASLGHAYFSLERFADAAQAYGKANALTEAQPVVPWLTAEGEARIFMNDSAAMVKAVKLFSHALQLDPQDIKANWYAGMLAYQAQDYHSALRYWLTLRDKPLPDNVRMALNHQLQIVAERAGVELPAAPAPSTAAAPAASGTQLTLTIAVAPALADQIPANGTLMVFARRVGGGPPLAIKRMPFSGNAQVVLSDSDAVMSGMNLSSADQWQVTARISQSGMAQSQPGDLEGQVLVQKANASQPVSVTIDQRIN